MCCTKRREDECVLDDDGVGDVGEEFEEPLIVGVEISTRSKEDVLSVWVNECDNESRFRVGEKIKEILHLGANTLIEYKAISVALRDHSSFRNAEQYIVVSDGAGQSSPSPPPPQSQPQSEQSQQQPQTVPAPAQQKQHGRRQQNPHRKSPGQAPASAAAAAAAPSGVQQTTASSASTATPAAVTTAGNY